MDSYSAGYEHGYRDAERVLLSDIQFHKEAVRRALQREHEARHDSVPRKHFEQLERMMANMAAMQTPVWLIPVKPPQDDPIRLDPAKPWHDKKKWFDYVDYIVPTKIMREVPPSMDAARKLEEVKSHVANLEGKLAQAEKKIKENEQANKYFDARALYVNLDGTTLNEAARCEYGQHEYGPAREIRRHYLSSPTLVDPGQWNPGVMSRHRYYRLAFSQSNKLHVYQEIG